MTTLLSHRLKPTLQRINTARMFGDVTGVSLKRRPHCLHVDRPLHSSRAVASARSHYSDSWRMSFAICTVWVLYTGGGVYSTGLYCSAAVAIKTTATSASSSSSSSKTAYRNAGIEIRDRIFPRSLYQCARRHGRGGWVEEVRERERKRGRTDESKLGSLTDRNDGLHVESGQLHIRTRSRSAGKSELGLGRCRAARRLV